MINKKKKWFYYGSGLLLILLFVMVILLIRSEEPPIVEIGNARRKIAEAETIKSFKYAQELYLNATAYYDSAMLAWHNENQRLIPFRDYNKVKNYAFLAYSLAEKAVILSNEKISKTEELLGFRISQLEEELKELIDNYGKIPINADRINDLSKSKMLLSEGMFAYNHGNYQSATSKLDSAESLILIMAEHYEETIYAYLELYPQWKQWVNLTIAESKKNKTVCIVIDKFTRECMLYKNGKAMKKFNVELGMNWIGDKNQQGDKSTPEGLYRIQTKKVAGETQYYKALLLNYPNEDDKIRFLLNKKNNVIRQDAKIGDLIEIHGNGGKGIDWTDGCIALKDSDMDNLFEDCRVGTRVTIVGSTKSFEELFSKTL